METGNKFIQILSCSLLILFFACTKEVVEPEIDGEEPTIETLLEGFYVGVFSVYYDHNETTLYDSTQVQFKDGYFTNPENQSLLPLGGSGTYIDLMDSLEFTQYVAWPGINDWNLYLEGKYAYTRTGNHLTFHKSVSNNIYQYDLYLE